MLPVEAGEIGIALHLRDGGQQAEEVAAFLDGHLVFLAGLAVAVNLAVGHRVNAEVVRREREFPAFAGGVIHERNQKRLRQRRAEKQELRGHRIKDIRGADATVGVGLFAELHRLAVVVGDEFAGGEALAVSEGAELGILHAASTGEIGHEFVVEGRAALHERGVFLRASLEQVGGFPTIAPPVGAEIFLHELDGVEIVVGEHEPARDGLVGDFDAIEPDVQVGSLRLARNFLGAGGDLRRGADRRVLGSRRSQIQVAPVDANVVALL